MDVSSEVGLTPAIEYKFSPNIPIQPEGTGSIIV
jgi:hypothetical protein